MRATLGAALSFSLPFLPAAADTHEQSLAIEHAQYYGTEILRNSLLFHVQGVDLDSKHIWVTSVDIWNHRGYLHEFDRATGVFLQRLELTDGARYHTGGFSIADHSLWVPVAEYKPNSTTVLEEIDTDSLRIRRKIRVADHLGCVAASGHYLVAGNWDSQQFYVIDLTGQEPMRVMRNPSTTNYQDMKFIDGQLVASGYRSWVSGTIDWIDFPSMKIVKTLHTGAIDYVNSLTGEGMSLQGHDLYVLPKDDRLFHFRIDADQNDIGRKKQNRFTALTPG